MTDDAPLPDLALRAADAPEEDDPLAAVLPDRLDGAPYRRDVELVDGSWSETLTLKPSDSDSPTTLFIASENPGTAAKLIDSSLGDVIAEADFVGEVEEDGGSTRFVSRIEVDPSAFPDVELVVEGDPEPQVRLVLCDELVFNRNSWGAGSLPLAVSSVRAGGSVCFDPVVFGSGPPIVLPYTLGINKSMTLNGPLSGRASVETGEGSRVLYISPGTVVISRDISYRHGEGQNGGVIYSDADHLYLRDCEIAQGTAVQGGGSIRGREPLTPGLCDPRHRSLGERRGDLR